MTDPENPQPIADTDLDAVQGAGTAVGNPGESKVLDRGASPSGILFFDEADALMGKRGRAVFEPNDER